MKRLINWLLGYALVQAEGAFPERLLNLCAQNRLPFWALHWLDETSFTFKVRIKDLKRLREYGERAMCTLTVEDRRGGAAAALRWRRRWGFVAGLALALLAAMVLSRFVLVVEVTGNERVPTAVILSELQRLGVRPGAWGPGLDRTDLANQALMGLPQLSFLSLNLYGTRVEAVVREADPAPKLLDEATPADVVAAADGIILDIHTAAGRAMFQDGDTVAKGEVLISADVELPKPENSQANLGRLVVRAAGEVTARTWRTMEAAVPLTAQAKVYTGQERTLYTGKILWKDLQFYRNSGISYERYDKISTTNSLTLFGREAPLALTRTLCREYTLEERPVDTDAARTMLEAQLQRRLDAVLEETDGEALRVDYTAREENGLFIVTMLAECREQIGKTVERDGETGRVHGDAAPAEH